MRDLFERHNGYLVGNTPETALINGRFKGSNRSKGNVLTDFTSVYLGGEESTIFGRIELKNHTLPEVKINDLEVMALEGDEIFTHNDTFDELITLSNYVIDADDKFRTISDLRNFPNRNSRQHLMFLRNNLVKQFEDTGAKYALLGKPLIRVKELPGTQTNIFYEKPDDSYTGRIIGSALLLK